MAPVHLTSMAVQRPSRRLALADVAAAWGRQATGELAVCGPDEDAITLAVDAAAHVPHADVDTVVLASPTPPRPGSSGAATAVVALGLPRTTRTIDVAGGDRCVTDAIAVACDLVRAGSSRRVLVLAGDDRAVPHDHPDELGRGHAGMAALISSVPGVAEVVASTSVADAAPDRWVDGHGATRTAGDRFLASAVWPALVQQAVADAEVTPHLDGLAGVHVATSTPKLAGRLAAEVDGDADGSDPTAWGLGDAGALMAGVLAAFALRSATEGDRHLLANPGSGVAVVVLRAGPACASVTVDDGAPLASLPYGIALRHTGRFVVGPSAPDASPVTAWRDTEAVVGLVGAQCDACGTRAYPRWSSCPSCGEPGPGMPVRLAGTGRVGTFTTDHLVAGVNPGTPESPTTMVVVDLDAGGRVFLPAVAGMDTRVGQRVRTVLRVAHDGGGFRHYHWRVAPVSSEELHT